MQTLQDSFSSSNPPQNMVIEGHLHDSSYDLQIYDVHWTEPGEGTFNPQNYCFIELLYFPIKHIQGAYAESGCEHKKRTLGNVLVVPPGKSLHTTWTTGYQKTLSCLLDVSTMGVLAGYDWQWQNIELLSTLDIQNAYLESLLKRLAAETAAPSYSSKIEVDCLLTLIAFELRRQFPGLGLAKDMASRKLSPEQMSLLRENILSTTGLGPSLEDLAEVVDMPVRNLSASFKMTTGKTLRQYIAESRIEKAKAVIMNRQLLIKEVAYQCGFKNAAAFTAAFRNSVGITPQEFRSGEYKKLN